MYNAKYVKSQSKSKGKISPSLSATGVASQGKAEIFSQ